MTAPEIHRYRNLLGLQIFNLIGLIAVAVVLGTSVLRLTKFQVRRPGIDAPVFVSAGKVAGFITAFYNAHADYSRFYASQYILDVDAINTLMRTTRAHGVRVYNAVANAGTRTEQLTAVIWPTNEDYERLPSPGLVYTINRRSLCPRMCDRSLETPAGPMTWPALGVPATPSTNSADLNRAITAWESLAPPLRDSLHGFAIHHDVLMRYIANGALFIRAFQYADRSGGRWILFAPIYNTTTGASEFNEALAQNESSF